MHRTYIADIERGARNVTLRSIASLATALQISAGNLLSYVTTSAEAALFVGDDTAPGKVGEILLVEDNATDAEITVHAFKRAKVTNPIKVVRDGEHGLDYLFGTGREAKRNSVRPRLILLDLNLPQMSGLEFLRRIKGDDRTRDIPVIVLTVSQTDRTIIECARLGAENYIIKPVSFDNFCKVTPKFSLRWTLSQPGVEKEAARDEASGKPRRHRPNSGDASLSAPPCVMV